MLSNKETRERCEFCAFVTKKDDCRYFCDTYHKPCNQIDKCKYDEGNDEHNR